MSVSINQWLVDQLPHVIEMAKLPFDQVTHEAFCRRVGWELFREDWYSDQECFFEVRFDGFKRRLVAVYGEPESGIGIGLYALGWKACERVFTTQAEFDEAFRSTLAVIEPLIESAAIRGAYAGDELNYAYWSFPATFLTLVQHHEGDLQSGSNCSLDIRIVPRDGATVLKFPLTTNILF
jgi:hypothetical protein